MKFLQRLVARGSRERDRDLRDAEAELDGRQLARARSVSSSAERRLALVEARVRLLTGRVDPGGEADR